MDSLSNNNNPNTYGLMHDAIKEELLKKESEIIKLTTLLQDAERQCISLDQRFNDMCSQYDSTSEQLSRSLEDNFDLKQRFEGSEKKIEFMDHIMKSMQVNDLNVAANLIVVSIQEHFGVIERTNETESVKDLRQEIDMLVSLSNKQKQELNILYDMKDKYVALENGASNLTNDNLNFKSEIIKLCDLIESKNEEISKLKLLNEENKNISQKSIKDLEESNKSVEELEIKYKKECLVFQKSMSTYKETINHKDKIITGLENHISNLKNHQFNSEHSISIPNISTDNIKQEYDSLLIEQTSLNKEIQDLHSSLLQLNTEHQILKREYELLKEKQRERSLSIQQSSEQNIIVPTSVEMIKELRICKQNEIILIERLRIAEMEIYQWQIKHDQLFNYNQAAQHEISILKQFKNITSKDNDNEEIHDDIDSWGFGLEDNGNMLELKEVLTFRQLLDGGLANMMFLSCQNLSSNVKPYIQKGYSYLKRRALRRSINSKMLILVYLALIHIYLLFFCIF